MNATFATATISQRIDMIEEALAVVLDRGGNMSVEQGPTPYERSVYVIAEPYSDRREFYRLDALAREIERLLP